MAGSKAELYCRRRVAVRIARNPLSTPIQPNPGQRRRLRAALLKWYDANRRDLPWRRTRDPYAIWISEIMLQQTRVAAVLVKYAQFLQRFPTVESLAKAAPADVLSLWSGLGYYRRARALQEAARAIVASGMPRTAAEWQAMPGVGRYTANAIASIAAGERCAVVDGNVERVVRRMTAQGNASIRYIWDTVEDWLSPRRPGDFNQAMMELGATVCLPGRPKCAECPLRKWCSTRGGLPPGKTRARLRKEVSYVLAERAGSVYLRQRGPGERLMPLMWELPEIESNGHTPAFTVRHSITVTDYKVSVVRAGPTPRGGKWIPAGKVAPLALTGLARKILRKAAII